ncbi:MAG: hypothetical protein JSS27_12920 [Planctomycetes bacterium]|nr:hypothetical protein [Planctomycetota bacterium]
MLDNWLHALLRSRIIAAFLLIACLGGTAAALFGVAHELRGADQATVLPREQPAAHR